VDNISEMEFGKGYQASFQEFRSVVSLLETIYTKRKMHIILIGHTKIVKHSDPSVGAEWERHELKLRPDTADLLVNWAKLVAFCAHETFTTQKKKTDKVRGVSTGKRVMFCEPQATFLAKNRYSLPAKLPLDWNELYAAINSTDVAEAMAALRAEATEKLPMVPEARRAKAGAYMMDPNRTLPELKQGMNLINSLVVEVEPETPTAASNLMANGAAQTTAQPVAQA
jgi:AAA domain